MSRALVQCRSMQCRVPDTCHVYVTLAPRVSTWNRNAADTHTQAMSIATIQSGYAACHRITPHDKGKHAQTLLALLTATTKAKTIGNLQDLLNACYICCPTQLVLSPNIFHSPSTVPTPGFPASNARSGVLECTSSPSCVSRGLEAGSHFHEPRTIIGLVCNVPCISLTRVAVERIWCNGKVEHILERGRSAHFSFRGRESKYRQLISSQSKPGYVGSSYRLDK